MVHTRRRHSKQSALIPRGCLRSDFGHAEILEGKSEFNPPVPAWDFSRRAPEVLSQLLTLLITEKVGYVC